jgi:uncharacterized protein YjdB
MVRTTEGRGKRDRFLSLSIAGALLLVSCESSVIELDEVQESSRISIDQGGLEFVAIGDTAELRVVRPAGESHPNNGLVHWSSLDPNVARVAPTGRVISAGPGTTSIIATSQCCGSDTISVRVRQLPDKILIFARADVFAIGDTARFTATAYDRNGVTIAEPGLVWTISNSDVARVDAAGVLTALSHGSADVIAAVADASANVAANDSGKGTKGGPGGPGSKPIKVRSSGSLVVQPLEVTLTALEDVAQLEARLIEATGSDAETRVTWRSLDRKVAAVDDNGIVTSIARGSARVVAAAKCCGADTVVVDVEPRVATIEIPNCPGSLNPGETVQLLATLSDRNGNLLDAVSPNWVTSNTSVATVDQAGNVTAKAIGTAEITASADDAALTVSMPVNGTDPLEPGTLTLNIIPSWYRFTAVGQEAQLRVIGTTEVGDTVLNPGVNWSSSDRNVVEVDAMGRIFSRGAGTAVITASCTLCLSGTMSASVAQTGSAIQWNAGTLNTLSEHIFGSSIEEDGWANLSPSRVSLVQDPTAPHGLNVAQRLYPEGEMAGTGTAMARPIPGKPTVVHVGVVLKISENYVNDAANLSKIFYLWSAGKSKFILSAHDGQNYQLRVLLRHSPGNTGYLVPNLAGARLKPGHWHRVEFRVESASRPEMGTSADGRARVWLDGVLTHDYRGLDTHFKGQDLHWEQVQWSTIRGGVSPDNPHAMWWWANALFIAAGN